MTREKLSSAHARAMVRRLPRFALCWLGTTTLWNLTLVVEGLAGAPETVIALGAQGIVLFAAYATCHTKAPPRRIAPILVATCVLQGAIPTGLFAWVGANGDVLAVLLLTLYLAAALFFAWGWAAELVLLSVTVGVWLAAAPYLVFHTPTIEIVTAIVIGTVLSLAMAEASARSFRLAYIHWANDQRGKRELESSRDEAEKARDQAERSRLEAEQAREEAERACKEAEAATRAKDLFLAMVSHELRSPIGAMMSWTQIIRRESAGSTRLEHALDVIERNTRAQARLIEDLLDVSRIVSGKLKVEMAPIDICAVVHVAVDVLRPAAEAKYITLETALPEQRIEVCGDAARLHQVVENLISNAIKFTPNGGHVSVSVREDGGQMEFTVHDSGMGIDPARLQRVFERFEQADPATARRQGGLGLGLAIARHIVQLHGGTIEAESSGAGHGSIFRVRLPVYSDEKRAEPRESARP